ncbi:MAG: hypothetical protein M0P27_00905 [Bacteroidales bacterium]|nr:hypothetical protein [Bacteroidales bacterium]
MKTINNSKEEPGFCFLFGTITTAANIFNVLLKGPFKKALAKNNAKRTIKHQIINDSKKCSSKK